MTQVLFVGSFYLFSSEMCFFRSCQTATFGPFCSHRITVPLASSCCFRKPSATPQSLQREMGWGFVWLEPPATFCNKQQLKFKRYALKGRRYGGAMAQQGVRYRGYGAGGTGVRDGGYDRRVQEVGRTPLTAPPGLHNYTTNSALFTTNFAYFTTNFAIFTTGTGVRCEGYTAPPCCTFRAVPRTHCTVPVPPCTPLYQKPPKTPSVPWFYPL